MSTDEVGGGFRPCPPNPEEYSDGWPKKSAPEPKGSFYGLAPRTQTLQPTLPQSDPPSPPPKVSAK
jgi:hypothetical protein